MTQGRGQVGVGEGVTGSALSIGTPPRVGAVPDPEIWALENVSATESSFDTSAWSGGETKKRVRVSMFSR